MCMHMKQKCAHVCQTVQTHIFVLCAYVFTSNYMKIVLIVQNYVMTSSFIFHKDLNFCCGDICKLTLNMHAKGINASAKFRHTCMRVFALPNFFFVNNCDMSLSFEFHKDPILWRYLQNAALRFFCRYRI